MSGIGSGINGELTLIDILSIISFLVGIENLQMNVTQEDAQNLQKDLADKAGLLLREIHGHLEQQDKKLDEIMKEMKKHDS